MALDLLHNATNLIELEKFIDDIRPPIDIRAKLDIGYKIENQSVHIFEIRPHPVIPNKKIESAVAKATFVKSSNNWKIYWMRGNLKWYLYEPSPYVKTLREFFIIVKNDSYGCFWG